MYTALDLSNLVIAMAGRSPHHVIDYTDKDQMLAFLSRKMDEWASRTRCFYDPKCAFTPVVSVAEYDIQASFTRRFISIDQVTVSDNILTNWSGNIGPVTPTNTGNFEPSMSAASDSQPRMWWFQPPRSVRLFPAPDDDYSNCYVSGWYMPEKFKIDGDPFPLSDADFEAFAKWCASALIVPMKDEDDMKRWQWLRQEGEERIVAFNNAQIAQRARGMSSRAQSPIQVRMT